VEAEALQHEKDSECPADRIDKDEDGKGCYPWGTHSTPPGVGRPNEEK